MNGFKMLAYISFMQALRALIVSGFVQSLRLKGFDYFMVIDLKYEMSVDREKCSGNEKLILLILLPCLDRDSF